MSTVLVTGANRGIGLELCRLLAGRGDEVLAVCRRPSPELSELGVTIYEDVDVTRRLAVGQLAEAVAGKSIDWLVNNAGILRRETLDDLDLETIRLQFEVNALAPLRLTAALLGNLQQGSKVGLVTSRMGSIADNTSGNRYGYRMSKAALNMAGVSLAHDLRPRGIAVALIHPGFVRTGMTGGTGNVEPADAAAGIVARMDALTLQTSGGFWHQNGETLPW